MGVEAGVPADPTPTGVAAGEGAVWVVVHGERDSQLLANDPASLRIMRHTPFPGAAAIDSVAVGLGYVWVVGSSSKTLYRIDPRTGNRHGEVPTGTIRAPRPYLMRRFVWVGPRVFDPRTLDVENDDLCCPHHAEEAYSEGFASRGVLIPRREPSFDGAATGTRDGSRRRRPSPLRRGDA